MVIHLAYKLHNGSQISKVSSSWFLESQIEDLHIDLPQGKAINFSHVRQNGNKVADHLANMVVGLCQPLRACDWHMFPDMIACSQCHDLITSDCTSVQMEGRNNY